MRPIRPALAVLFVVACASLVGACGSSSSSSSSGSSKTSPTSSNSASSGLSLAGLANTKPDPAAQHMGGTLPVISAAAWEHLDPGAAYSQLDYLVVYATQTPLYEFTPTSPTKPVPLLAAGPPTISGDGKTVTVHIKHGFKFREEGDPASVLPP